MEKVKWLLVGAGDIVQSRVASALSEAVDSELVAICARSKGRVDTIAAKMQINNVYYDYEQALAETEANAVYIATPHHLHVDMCMQALAANKHFLCEKPLGINSIECLKLLDAVRESDRITCCSNYRLFTNQFKMTKKLIDSGEIGRLIGGWAHDEESYYNPGNAPYLKELGMSPVITYGFYLINIALILFGMPSEVFAIMSSFNCDNKPEYDIDDLENIILKFPGGRQFSIIINNTARAPLRHSYQFYCSGGRVLWPECPPHFNSPIQKVAYPDGYKEIENSWTGDSIGVNPNWHTPMIEDFVRSIQSCTQPVCTIESAVKTAVITDAILKSAASGQLEPIIWKD